MAELSALLQADKGQPATPFIQARARRAFCILVLALLLSTACAYTADPATTAPPQSLTWRFDQLRTIGGKPVRVEGQPRVVRTEHGRAVEFDGLDDALFVDTHPLAGAQTFTIEAIFRPYGGAAEQRWLHLAERAPNPAPLPYPPVEPAGPRLMFELRVVKDSWYLDAFASGPGYRQPLMFPEKTFPLGRWYHVAQVYDGKSYRSYVNGTLQGEAEIAFTPQGDGYSSIGTRINRRDYFKGAVLLARFTRKALSPEEFLHVDK